MKQYSIRKPDETGFTTDDVLGYVPSNSQRNDDLTSIDSNDVIVDRSAAKSQAIALRKTVNSLKDELYTQNEVEEELSSKFLELTGKQKQSIIEDIFNDESDVWSSLGIKETIKRFESMGLPESFELLPTETRLNGYAFEADAFTVRKILRMVLINARKATEEEIKDDLFLKIHNKKLGITQREMYMIVNAVLEDIKYNGKIVIPNFERIEWRTYDDNDENGEIIRQKDVYKPLVDYSLPMTIPFKHFASFIDGSGKGFLFDPKRADCFIQGPEQYHSMLSEKGCLLNFIPGQINERKFFEYCKFHNTNTYDRFTLIPEIEQDEMTKFIGEDIEPEDNGMLLEFIKTLTLESEKDRYRYVAGMFSPCMGRRFDGRKPMPAVVASARGSGKTDIVVRQSQIVEGENPIQFNGDEKDKNQISGIKRLAQKNVIFDNLQNTTFKTMLKITRNVTDPEIEAWFMNLSHTTVRNNKTYWATFNSEEGFNEDIMNRIMIIRMADGRDIDTREKANISKKLDYFVKNRKKIVANMLWYLQQEPRDDFEIDRHPKFGYFSEEMGKILSVIFPHVKVFDFNLSEEDRELSIDHAMMNDFLNKILRGCKSKRYTNEEMLPIYKQFFDRNFATTNGCTRHLKSMAKSLTKYRLEHKPMKFGGITKRGYEITDLNWTEENSDYQSII